MDGGTRQQHPLDSEIRSKRYKATLKLITLLLLPLLQYFVKNGENMQAQSNTFITP
jgi:hypothetical protein